MWKFIYIHTFIHTVISYYLFTHTNMQLNIIWNGPIVNSYIHSYIRSLLLTQTYIHKLEGLGQWKIYTHIQRYIHDRSIRFEGIEESAHVKHIYIHTYIHAYIHTYIYTYILWYEPDRILEAVARYNRSGPRNPSTFTIKEIAYVWANKI